MGRAGFTFAATIKKTKIAIASTSQPRTTSLTARHTMQHLATPKPKTTLSLDTKMLQGPALSTETPQAGLSKQLPKSSVSPCSKVPGSADSPPESSESPLTFQGAACCLRCRLLSSRTEINECVLKALGFQRASGYTSLCVGGSWFLRVSKMPPRRPRHSARPPQRSGGGGGGRGRGRTQNPSPDPKSRNHPRIVQVAEVLQRGCCKTPSFWRSF